MLNVCAFTGNLASEPLYFDGEQPRAVFTLAVDHNGKTADGQKKTEFLDFVAWRGTAEYIHKYCHKGDMLSVRSEARKRELVKDGVKSFKYEFHVDSVDMVKRAKSNWDDAENS